MNNNASAIVAKPREEAKRRNISVEINISRCEEHLYLAGARIGENQRGIAADDAS